MIVRRSRPAMASGNGALVATHSRCTLSGKSAVTRPSAIGRRPGICRDCSRQRARRRSAGRLSFHRHRRSASEAAAVRHLALVSTVFGVTYSLPVCRGARVCVLSVLRTAGESFAHIHERVRLRSMAAGALSGSRMFEALPGHSSTYRMGARKAVPMPPECNWGALRTRHAAVASRVTATADVLQVPRRRLRYPSSADFRNSRLPVTYDRLPYSSRSSASRPPIAWGGSASARATPHGVSQATRPARSSHGGTTPLTPR